MKQIREFLTVVISKLNKHIILHDLAKARVSGIARYPLRVLLRLSLDCHTVQWRNKSITRVKDGRFNFGFVAV